MTLIIMFREDISECFISFSPGEGGAPEWVFPGVNGNQQSKWVP